MQIDAITAVAMDTGREIVESFKLTRHQAKFAKWRMMRRRNVQRQAPAALELEQHSIHKVQHHTGLEEMSTVWLSMIAR